MHNHLTWGRHVNDECCTDFTGDQPNFMFMQEDHWDQHMDEDEDRPSWEDIIFQIDGAYIWKHDILWGFEPDRDYHKEE